MARLKVKQISDFTSAVQNLIDNDPNQSAAIISAISTEADAVSTALVNEISATNTDVSTLTSGLAAVSASEAAVSASEAAVSAALVSEIATTNNEVSTLTSNLSAVSTSEAAVSAALASEISTTDGEISTLQSKVTQLEGDSEYIHDYATMAGTTSFRCNVAMEHDSDDDMQVFINGHAIGRVRTVEGTKYGWEHQSSGNNLTFDLHNIGYDLEAEDVIYVVSHK